jgi:dephospho-CoA kinase
MLKVGLTGGLASGKSFVGRCLTELGAHVAQADRMGHEVLEPGGEAFDEVVAAFGREILDEQRRIDRKRLGAAVFGDPKKLDRLNTLVHPHVFARQEVFFADVEKKEPRGVAVIEAAIMIETGSYKRYDRLVLAACPEEEQIRRFIDREGGDETQARARLARQMPLAEKRRYADYIVDTSGTKEETRVRTAELWGKLRQEAENKAE